MAVDNLSQNYHKKPVSFISEINPALASRSKPVITVVYRDIRIPIYSGTCGGYKNYVFSFYEGGQRVQRRYGSLQKAKTKAKEAAKQLSEGTGRVSTLSNDQITDYTVASKILVDYPGFTLAGVVSEYFRAYQILGSQSVLAACEAQARAQKAQNEFKPATVQQVYEDFIARLKKNDASSRYLEDCRSRMKRIADSIKGMIHNVSTTQISDCIDSFDVSPRTRRNFRTAAVTLWKFAKERGHLPRNLETEAELIPAIGRLKSGKKEAEIGIYTPSEFHKILTAAQKHLLAPIAIGGFAGLRSAEVHRLLWGEVHDSHIVVKAGNAKTGSRRIVPVLPALKAWLAKVERGDPTERVCARFSHENGLARAQTVAIKSAGVVPVHNGLRHSFCTYRLADIQDAAKVALEAGNSPQMLFKHYRALATATTATEWFAIGMPASRSRGRPRSRKAKQKKKSAA